ncbi:MAG: ribosomal biogenesis protein [Thermoplasmata archaeon]|nr:ribosomal biogenesis protein [Thermoplasmata archaeon]
MPFLKTKWFGVFVYDEEIIDKKLFPKNADEIAKRLYKIQKGEVLEEEEAFKDYDLVVDENRLKKIGKLGKIKELKVKAEDFGYSKELLLKACIKLATKKIEEEQKERTKRIGEAVDALDDIIKITNMVLERLRDWYSYFSFEEIEDGKELAEKILKMKIGGNELDKLEEKSIKSMASLLLSLYKIREEIERYIREVMEEMAPNVCKIVGSNIGARLIAYAGGIEKLATMPAGTIQVLGAEKALFRHIKDGTPPPKHGIIFQHEMINRAPKNKRGKIARLLATKLAIAAKADAFTKNYIADKLKKEIDERYKEIMKS